MSTHLLHLQSGLTGDEHRDDDDDDDDADDESS